MPLNQNHRLLVAMRYALGAYAPSACLFTQSMHHPEECPACGLVFATACLERDTQRVDRFLAEYPELQPITTEGL